MGIENMITARKCQICNRVGCRNKSAILIPTMNSGASFFAVTKI